MNKKAYIPCEIVETQINNGLDIRVRIDKTHDLYINRKLLIPDIDQPKPVVPQFVADWIEICDMRFVNLNYIFGENCPEKVKEWASVYGNHKKMLQALLYGYTVQKEKLYTVEIPNPNGSLFKRFVLCKYNDNGVFINCINDPSWEIRDKFQLTEAEIRKDFDWAWQWKKEVRE